MDRVVRRQNGGGNSSEEEEETIAENYAEADYYDEGADGEGDYQPSSEELQQSANRAATPLEYQAPLEERIDSYNNYCTLFNHLLNSAGGPVELDVTAHYWAWDVIDEFIYQFNHFCTYRNRLARNQTTSPSHDEVQILRDNTDTWSAYIVLNILYSMIQRSEMNQQLQAYKLNREPLDVVSSEYAKKQLYRLLGYYSILGLLRIQCLLGDFSLALKVLDDIEMTKRPMFNRVLAAQISTFYYIGVSYMMVHRHSDALKNFSHAVILVTRQKFLQKHGNNAQFDSITKKVDQMYALIAICASLSPGARLEETVHNNLREKLGEPYAKLQRGGPESFPVYEELFRSACPKFISPTPPDFDRPEYNIDPLEHHLSVFMARVQVIQIHVPALKSYLKLYHTMDLPKLAGFLEVSPDKLRSLLMVMRTHSNQVKHKEGGEGLLSGELARLSDIECQLDGDTITVEESKQGRKLTDWYLRNLARAYTQ